MAAFPRLMILALVALSIVYASLWFYARAVRREKLEAEWQMQPKAGAKEAFVKEQLDAYEPVLKRRLIWAVYVIPTALIALLIYLTNDA